MPDILYNGPTSPFGRMARVVSLELDHSLEERVIDVYNAEFLGAINPLRQIPTLVTAAGASLYDSRVICSYFDAASGRPSLIPAALRWEVETRWALAIGIMETGLQRRMEMVRPSGEQSLGVIAKLEVRLDRALDGLEQQCAQIRDASVRMDTLATAVALEYTDFRFSNAWRQRCPGLSGWLDEFSRRSSMTRTRPREPGPHAKAL